MDITEIGLRTTARAYDRDFCTYQRMNLQDRLLAMAEKLWYDEQELPAVNSPFEDCDRRTIEGCLNEFERKKLELYLNLFREFNIGFGFGYPSEQYPGIVREKLEELSEHETIFQELSKFKKKDKGLLYSNPLGEDVSFLEYYTRSLNNLVSPLRMDRFLFEDYVHDPDEHMDALNKNSIIIINGPVSPSSIYLSQSDYSRSVGLYLNPDEANLRIDEKDDDKIVERIMQRVQWFCKDSYDLIHLREDAPRDLLYYIQLRHDTRQAVNRKPEAPYDAIR